jgi:hypothetical protein
MEEIMKKFSMTGFAVWLVLLALSFPACDASLDPSDEGNSGISEPWGELTITNISPGVTITGVRVYNTTDTPKHLDVLPGGNWSPIASASPISNSNPTVTLKAGGSPWNGTGSYGVFLARSISGLTPNTIVGHWKTITFAKGRATARFGDFSAITVPEEDEEPQPQPWPQ